VRSRIRPGHDARMQIGHVHLKVADLDRAIAFYRDVLGLKLTVDGREAGFDVAFLADGDYHHHVGLNASDSAGGEPPAGHTGLYHVAFLYPDREALAGAVRRVIAHGHPIDHGTDHGATVSVYLADPDANGIELYYDRPRRDWFDDNGRPVLKLDYFEPVELLSTPHQGA
jgi:catechol 2,3-dioxygenase